MMIETRGSLHREPLNAAVQERVKDFIIEQGYGAGHALPSEADLSALLGVSRPSLREALRVLATLGVIESRHGQGTFVGTFSLKPFIDGLSFGIRVSNPNDAAKAIKETMEIRALLEEELLRRVTPTLPDSTIAALEEVVSRMEAKAGRQEEFSEEDRLFHELLYRDIEDLMMTRLVHGFWDVFDNLRQDLPNVIAELSDIVQHHRSILEAVRRHDAEAAVRALDEHFAGLRSRVQG